MLVTEVTWSVVSEGVAGASVAVFCRVVDALSFQESSSLCLIEENIRSVKSIMLEEEDECLYLRGPRLRENGLALLVDFVLGVACAVGQRVLIVTKVSRERTFFQRDNIFPMLDATTASFLNKAA